METLKKQGYKQTELGLIPEDWEIKEISQISKVVRGGSPRPAGSLKYFYGDFIPWLTVASLTNISEYDIIVNSTFSFLTEEGSKLSRVLEKGTLIIANSGATLGVAKILGIKSCANDGIAALLEVNSENDVQYIVYSINSITSRLRETIATGNGQPNLNTSLIGALKFAFPSSKKEQTAIATALSDMDSYISSLESLIAKKRMIKQGAMQELLTPKEDWEVKKLGEVLKVRHGKNQSEVEEEDGQFPILASGGEIGRSRRFIYNKPSVLIGRKGTIDKPMFMDTPFWTVDTLYYTEINNGYDAKFIFYHFQLIDWYGYNEASGVPSLSSKTIHNIEIWVPTNKPEQVKISAILTDIENGILRLEEKLEKAKQLKQGMMQDLLTGKRRLIKT